MMGVPEITLDDKAGVEYRISHPEVDAERPQPTFNRRPVDLSSYNKDSDAAIDVAKAAGIFVGIGVLMLGGYRLVEHYKASRNNGRAVHRDPLSIKDPNTDIDLYNMS